MMQARLIQVVVWLFLVAVVFFVLLVCEQSSVLTYERWAEAQIASFLGIFILDWIYSLLGRAIMARRLRQGSRSSVRGEASAYLVASEYLPYWLVTMAAMAAASLLFFMADYVAWLHLSPPINIVFCLLAPTLARSRHWGGARFDADGVVVGWDDGVVTRLRWSMLPSIAFLAGKRLTKVDVSAFPRARSFRLLGAGQQPGIEEARRHWKAVRAAVKERKGREE